MRETLDGTTASGEYEARMGHEEFGKEVHVYSPAYMPGEVESLAKIAKHIYFNSPDQIRRYLPVVKKAGAKIGLRINPGYSQATLGGPLYDPCAPYSRFGAPRDMLDEVPWDEDSILHAHALCEARHTGSVGLIEHVAKNFAPYIRKVKAVNFGGGHFINKPGYDVDALIKAIKAFRAEFNVDVILEPGAGLVVDTGYLVASVLGHPPQRQGHRHPRRVGLNPHAGRARSALYAERHRREDRRSRRCTATSTATFSAAKPA